LIAATTGTNVLPLRVRRYSTFGGTTPKSLRSIRPLPVKAFNSRFSTRGAISALPAMLRSRPVRILPWRRGPSLRSQTMRSWHLPLIIF
jgi:hypothetical protein